jgi:hypothetical protein
VANAAEVRDPIRIEAGGIDEVRGLERSTVGGVEGDAESGAGGDSGQGATRSDLDTGVARGLQLCRGAVYGVRHGRRRTPERMPHRPHFRLDFHRFRFGDQLNVLSQKIKK